MKDIKNNSVFLKPTVSIVIPTKNEENSIGKCLTSIFNQSFKSFEVIIVDGNSTDNTLNKARKFPVTIIFEKEPTSLPNARNIGIQNANGEILLLLDADVFLEKNCLEKAVDHFHKSSVLAVVPSEIFISHSRLEEIHSVWHRCTKTPLRLDIGISSFAVFFRKHIFNQINFDPDLGFGEDVDFFSRFKQRFKGFGRIVYSDKTKIIVDHPHTLHEFRVRWTWWGRTFMKFFIKYFSIKTFLTFVSLLLPTSLIVLSFLTLFIRQLFPLLVLGFLLIMIRNFTASIRSKFSYLIEFICYDFLRSFFFTIGMLQGTIIKGKGK